MLQEGSCEISQHILVNRLTGNILATGGFKLWECAIDLAAYLCRTWAIEHLSRDFEQAQTHGRQKVLELGCGHGLPGILAHMIGMDVCFQVNSAFILCAHAIEGPIVRRPCSARPINMRSGTAQRAGELFYHGGRSSHNDKRLKCVLLVAREPILQRESENANKTMAALCTDVWYNIVQD